MNDSERQLIARDVAIKTVTVEVKVMKIGNRQVTLSVFRQLQSEPLLDPVTGKLCGIPWGKVNYHTDCDALGSHFHVVWQKGNELRQTPISVPWQLSDGMHHPSRVRPHPGYLELVRTLKTYASFFVLARILEGWEKPEGVRVPNAYESFPTQVVHIQVEGEDVEALLAPTDCLAWHTVAGYVEQGQETLREKLEKNHLNIGSQAIYSDFLVPSLHQKNQLLQTLQQSYTELEQLDQLFIAV